MIEWRCFLCGEVFTDTDQAALHFGTAIHHKPACQIDIVEYRRAESENQRYRDEDSDLHREIYGLQSKHQTELRRAEEQGYAKGLRDSCFQEAVAAWMSECFRPKLYQNITERGDRLLEEVLELLQAHGYDPSRVATLVDYVYNRPIGEPAQEVGGVMITLAGFCHVAGLSMHDEGNRELERIMRPENMEKIRAKQAAKSALHFDSPPPGNPEQQS